MTVFHKRGSPWASVLVYIAQEYTEEYLRANCFPLWQANSFQSKASMFVESGAVISSAAYEWRNNYGAT